MELPFQVLAVLGFAALLWRSLRAAARVLRRGADAIYAREIARTRARRGDVTGMEDARRQADRATRARRRSVAELGLWVALLILPPLLFSVPAPVYAAAAALWLIPVVMGTRSGASARSQS